MFQTDVMNEIINEKGELAAGVCGKSFYKLQNERSLRIIELDLKTQLFCSIPQKGSDKNGIPQIFKAEG